MTMSLQDVYPANILDTVRQPLLLLSAELRVVTANPAFYDMCHLTPAEAENQLGHTRARKSGSRCVAASWSATVASWSATVARSTP